MADIKDRIITAESLKAVHDHHTTALSTAKSNLETNITNSLNELKTDLESIYMSKWVDLGRNAWIDESNATYEIGGEFDPKNFVGFVAKCNDEENNSTKYITFTKTEIAKNGYPQEVKAHAFEFDESGNMQRYELWFYGGTSLRGSMCYILEASIRKFSVATGETSGALLSYTDLYGIKCGV